MQSNITGHKDLSSTTRIIFYEGGDIFLFNSDDDTIILTEKEVDNLIAIVNKIKDAK